MWSVGGLGLYTQIPYISMVKIYDYCFPFKSILFTERFRKKKLYCEFVNEEKAFICKYKKNGLMYVEYRLNYS